MNSLEKPIGYNDCFVTDNLISSARNLISGLPLNPINFADLCELIEICILHDRIVMTIPTIMKSPLEILLKEGIVTITRFIDVPFQNEHEKKLLKNVSDSCDTAIKDGSFFGLGVLDSLESPEESVRQAINRITVGEMILGWEQGILKLEKGADKDFQDIQKVYQVFKNYADAIFAVAQHFHVHAYFGASELPYAIKKTIRSIPLTLYDELHKLHKERTDKFLVSAGYMSYDIPPFAIIVLSRCKSRDDIVPEILKAREEFSKFRKTCTKFATQIHNATQSGTFGDIIDLQNDLDRSIEVLRKKIYASDKDTRFVYKLWNIIKAATPWGITKNVIDRLKDYDIDSHHLQTVNGIIDVWQKFKKGSTYEVILRSKLFPDEFHESHFDQFSRFLLQLREYMAIGIKL